LEKKENSPMSLDKENEDTFFGFENLYPTATVSIGLQGLAACCYNESFDNGRGRWEVAIPRFADHHLRIEIEGFPSLDVDEEVAIIEIKDRIGVPVPPKYVVGDTFNRKVHNQEEEEEEDFQSQNDNKDFRWVTDYSNNEIPQGVASVKEQLPPDLKITM